MFFDHDGGLDDFLILLMLLSYDDVDLMGISITPADTLAEGAVTATRKILGLAGRSDVLTAEGTRSRARTRSPSRGVSSACA